MYFSAAIGSLLGYLTQVPCHPLPMPKAPSDLFLSEFITTNNQIQNAVHFIYVGIQLN